jgi:N-acetyl-1-D-myo-inositol-2-amino-2-deoxy-alpha-D-glucopyranoside deacetylase
MVDGPFFALSNNIGAAAWGYEYYRLAKGPAVRGPDGAFEDDLFAGV